MQARATTAVLALCTFLAVFTYAAFSYKTSSSVRNQGLTTSNNLAAASIDLGWYSPSDTWITDLDKVVNGTGTFGFDFGSGSSTVDSGYAYCDMPRVHPDSYVTPSKDEFSLIYVEVVHRHHKRTPYEDNGFPEEPLAWDCADGNQHQMFGRARDASHPSAEVYWTIQQSSSNPFVRKGLHGSCKFPQITKEGQEDSWQHGIDLASVYRDHLGFLPAKYDGRIVFRVTNNVITTTIASMVIAGMFPDSGQEAIPLRIEPELLDSLEPHYRCPAAQKLTATSILGDTPTWTSHLASASQIFARLDEISGVSPSDKDFHMSSDHYYDNLSTRQCHGRPLPCSTTQHNKCVDQELANSVYRLGQWEYSWQHRGSPNSLTAAIGFYGVWFAEVASNLRRAIEKEGGNNVYFRHNVAHDGSVARILSFLQVDVMVWPGLGAEVVFELYRRKKEPGQHALRVLWNGRAMRSSNPSLGLIDMIDVDLFLGYVDGLVGAGAHKVVEYCSSTT